MNKTFTWRLLTPGELTDVYLQEMRRDFPAGELKPLSMILTSEAEGLAHTWGVFDGETLAAYLLMVRPEGSAISQLDYFAVVPAYRAGGLGAKLLTGCGGDQLADNEVQIGPFIVKVYGLDVALGTASGNDKGAITGKVKLRYDAGGSSWQGGSYNNMFKAVVVDANLTQVAPTGPFFVSDALVGKPFATEEKDLKLSFPTDEARQNFLGGKPAVMTITINGMTGVLFLMKRDDNSFVATRVG